MSEKTTSPGADDWRTPTNAANTLDRSSGSTIPLIPTRPILLDPATGAPPLAALIVLSAESSAFGRDAKRAGAQLAIGERRQGDESCRASDRRHDEAHERVDDRPGKKLSERPRIPCICST